MMTPPFMYVVAPRVHVCVCVCVCVVGFEPLESLKTMQYMLLGSNATQPWRSCRFFAANKMRDERERER